MLKTRVRYQFSRSPPEPKRARLKVGSGKIVGISLTLVFISIKSYINDVTLRLDILGVIPRIKISGNDPPKEISF